MLAGLQPERFMHEQLASAFSVQDSPVWMDSSTTEQCKVLEVIKLLSMYVSESI